MQKTYQEWKRFLGRPPISIDYDAVHRGLKGKRVLVTGAGDCIGSSPAKSCAQFPVESLIRLRQLRKRYLRAQPGAWLQSQIAISRKELP
jgi:hypothetical protein